jgi:hypothetical protein
VFLTRHALRLTETALLQLSAIGWGSDGKPGSATPVGVCIKTSDQWLTCAAIGRNDDGWVGASAYHAHVGASGIDGDDYPWLWHRPVVVDPTALYVEFLNLSTHLTSRIPDFPDIQTAELMGQTHRGLAHLLACYPDFTPEAGAFLANITIEPMKNPQFLHHSRRWTNRQTPFMQGPSSLSAHASGERTWLRWASPALTGGAEVLDGSSRFLGPQMLRQLRWQMGLASTREAATWGRS